MAGNVVFGVGNYSGQKTFHVQIFNSNFQPSKNGQQTLDCKQEVFSELFHTSVSCLYEDGLVLEQPTPCLFEGVHDDLFADFPLERHTIEFVQVDEKLPHAFCQNLISALFNN
jgi:hypothetical protein